MGCDCKFHTFFQFYHHWKINWSTIFIFIVYCRHSSKSSLSFNFWLIYENFYFRLENNTLFSTHFMILHNFCFLFLNWPQVVNVRHDSQYVAKHKFKCHCIRLHRIIKQIYIDKDNLLGQWAVGALSQVFKNLRSQDSLVRDRTTKICCLYWMLIIDWYSYLYSYSSTSTRTRTRTHVIIKYSDSYSDSHILQVLVLVLVLVNLVLAPALTSMQKV